MTDEIERVYPDVVEVKAKGKPGSGKIGILDDISDMLTEHDYVPILREETAPGEITDTYQHEKVKDDGN